MRKDVLKSRTTAVVAGAATLGVMLTGGAVAAGQIDSSDIKNDSVKSVDIKDGGIQSRDLSKSLQGRLASGQQTQALVKRLAALEKRVSELEKPTTPAPTWTANDGSVVNQNGALLVLAEGDTNGTSVETSNLGVPVKEGDTITFKYAASEGASCTGGAPRMFIVVDGKNTNSWDQLLPAGTQCGTDGVVTFKAADTGSIGAAGFVYDNGDPGKVTISDVTIAGNKISLG